MLLSHILSILNSDWLQHASNVCRVYELMFFTYSQFTNFFFLFFFIPHTCCSSNCTGTFDIFFSNFDWILSSLVIGGRKSPLINSISTCFTTVLPCPCNAMVHIKLMFLFAYNWTQLHTQKKVGYRSLANYAISTWFILDYYLTAPILDIQFAYTCKQLYTQETGSVWVIKSISVIATH